LLQLIGQSDNTGKGLALPFHAGHVVAIIMIAAHHGVGYRDTLLLLSLYVNGAVVLPSHHCCAALCDHVISGQWRHVARQQPREGGMGLEGMGEAYPSRGVEGEVVGSSLGTRGQCTGELGGMM
jgi:hypothetical protein